ncbi:MAG: hypothetical protein AUK35_05690 [Zetaproteobacteria bacterium CG2_30_46_52]|nr:MAG: hypothetical protein AUK35_05690 [Zetaproteobacteria bacterium CG2_30_46_52]
MFNKLKKLLTGAKSNEPAQKDHDISLAVTAMMVEIMLIDGKLDDKEHQTIVNTVQKRFSLTSAEVDTLIEEAKVAHDKSTDLHQFTSQILKHYSTQERIDFLAELWQVALADGEIDPYEEQLIRRVANLVGVYHNEYIQAKIQARDMPI